MNAMVGDAGEITGSGKNTNNPSYRQFFKMAQIPKPSQIFVFIEEHPDTIDDGYFINKFYKLEWHDLPASYHQGAAHLAFADGHIEKHRWVNASTKPAPVPDSLEHPIQIDATERDDLDWLMFHTSLKGSASQPTSLQPQ